MLYVCGGWIFVGLAIFGTIIPLLPSTPFLLLASWCFFRGSPRVHAWLHRFKWLSPTLDDWEQHHGIRKKTKRRAVILILLAVTGSLLLGSLEFFHPTMTQVRFAVFWDETAATLRRAANNWKNFESFFEVSTLQARLQARVANV